MYQKRLIKIPQQINIKHGEWEMGLDEGDYEYGTCSVCGYNEYNAFGCLLPHNYCPNCGAKMDGEDVNEERNEAESES